MKSALTFLSLFLVSVGLAAWPSQENEERKDPTLEERWEHSDTVVIGTVIEQKYLPAPFLEYKYMSAVETKLRIKRKWKGENDTGEILTFYMLSRGVVSGPIHKEFYDFTMGRDYVVFSRLNERNNLWFNAYSLPMEYNDITEIIEPMESTEERKLRDFLSLKTK
tara:strand:- start:177 stop:671 length:495 start_codon:yes stop_codon:yes gene_type:complete